MIRSVWIYSKMQFDNWHFLPFLHDLIVRNTVVVNTTIIASIMLVNASINSIMICNICVWRTTIKNQWNISGWSYMNLEYMFIDVWMIKNICVIYNIILYCILIVCFKLLPSHSNSSCIIINLKTPIVINANKRIISITAHSIVSYQMIKPVLVKMELYQMYRSMWFDHYVTTIPTIFLTSHSYLLIDIK